MNTESPFKCDTLLGAPMKLACVLLLLAVAASQPVKQQHQQLPAVRRARWGGWRAFWGRRHTYRRRYAALRFVAVLCLSSRPQSCPTCGTLAD